ncbi:hypothetical protein [Halomarina pelagica]|uniref:hypothetical protein n=1 Tax=Halomarina pelagica TaxID=2961599 RepID=UPI0020C2468A|nr:hypothetical protein [Halomarina sp. BND7]
MCTRCGNHHTAHQNITEFSSAALQADIGRTDEFFEECGIPAGRDLHIYPFGAYSGRTMDVLAEHFALTFGGGGSTNYSLTNPICVGSVGIGGDLAGAKALVDLTVEHRSLAIPLVHHMEPEQFDQLVALVHEQDRMGTLDVVTARDLQTHLQSLGTKS